MFDFDSVSAWDVGKEADKLTQSLFGGTKKKGKHKSYKNDQEVSVAAILDSDDETYTRKGVKKLKKKEKKKKKQGGSTAETPVPEVMSESAEKVKKKKKGKQVSKQLSEAGATQNVNSKGHKKKSEKGQSAGLTDNKESGKGKRKFSETEGGDTSISSGGKKIKLDTDSVCTTQPDEPAQKRRRKNRKKKNNSKKNKYAHLALNRKSELDPSKEDQGDGKSIEHMVIPEVGQRKLQSSFAESVKKVKSVQVENGIGKNSKPGTENIPTTPSDSGRKSLKRKKQKAVASGLSTAISTPKLEEESEVDHAVKKPTLTPQLSKNKKKAKNEQISSREIKDGMKSNKKIDLKKLESDNRAKQKTDKPIGAKFASSDDGNVSKLKQKQQKLQTILSGAGNVSEDGNMQSAKKKKTKKTTNSDFNNSSDTNTGTAKAIEKKVAGKVKSNSKEGNSDSLNIGSSIWQNKSSNLGSQAREKLNSARFRFINEQMYKCSGKEALQMFQEDRAAFKVYHEGFENQAARWPVNPVNLLIKQIKDKPKNLVLADFGCGDAKLARSVPQKVHSFDLVALNKRVTACDMTKVPLPKESIDVAVFCLSLMGTNLDDYIKEANRVLKDNGLLKIVEVVSRFNGPSSFIAGVCAHGFQLLNKRDVSEMFYLMDFRKVKPDKKTVLGKGLSLKPCVYKRR